MQPDFNLINPRRNVRGYVVSANTIIEIDGHYGDNKPWQP